MNWSRTAVSRRMFLRVTGMSSSPLSLRVFPMAARSAGRLPRPWLPGEVLGEALNQALDQVHGRSELVVWQRVAVQLAVITERKGRLEDLAVHLNAIGRPDDDVMPGMVILPPCVDRAIRAMARVMGRGEASEITRQGVRCSG